MIKELFNREFQSFAFIFLFTVILVNRFIEGLWFNDGVNSLLTIVMLGLMSKEIYDIIKQIKNLRKEKHNH